MHTCARKIHSFNIINFVCVICVCILYVLTTILNPDTSDVQHASIYTGPGEISVTCCFAVGSHALGCHVLIYMSTTPVAFGDIRRENTTDSSSMEWYLSDSATGVISGLEEGTYSVFLFDIERDNKLRASKLGVKTWKHLMVTIN